MGNSRLDVYEGVDFGYETTPLHALCSSRLPPAGVPTVCLGRELCNSRRMVYHPAVRRLIMMMAVSSWSYSSWSIPPVVGSCVVIKDDLLGLWNKQKQKIQKEMRHLRT